MSEETTQLVERLRRRLRRTVRRLTLADLAFGAALTLGVAAALWLLSAVVEAGFWLPTGPRSVVVGVAAAAVVGLLGYFVARPLLRLAGVVSGPSDEEAARHVGGRFPAIADRFVNLLQLAGGGRSSSSSDALNDRAVAHLGQQVEAVSFEEVEDFGRARRASRWAAVPLAGLLIFLLAAPGAFWGASARLLAPTEHFQRPAAFQLALAPAGAALVKGDSLRVTVRAEGEEIPRTVTLQTRNEGEERVEKIKLSADDDGRFRHTVSGVRRAFRYRAVAGRRPVRTAWHEARVTERPRVQSLRVTLTPPAYSGLPERRLDANVGDVTALPGTEVSVEARLGGPEIQRALLQFSGGGTDTLSVDDGTATGAFTLRREGAYHLALRSGKGRRNPEPIRYQLSLSSDAAPTIAMLAPAPEANLGDDLRAALRWQMSDDFGFAAMKLFYRLSERRYDEPMDAFESLDLPLDRPGLLDQEIVHDWLLRRRTDLDPVPGDVVEYYVKVWDNNAVAGYQSARTQTHRLRLPSLTEKYESLDEQQSSVEEQMNDLQQQREDLQRQFEGVRDELRKKRQGDWEDRRQVEQLKKKQQKLEQGVEQLARQLQETARQMQEGNLNSRKTTQMYRELQQVTQEINSPELQKALEKLQQSMQKMDMEKMQQALENFEFNEQQYQERLKRTLDLFKKIKAQQKLEEAARRTGKLAEQERRLAEESEKLSEREEEKGKREENERKNGGTEDERKTDEKNRRGDPAGSPEDEKQSSGEKQQSGEKQPSGDKKSSGEKSQQQKREQLAQQQDRASEEMKKLRKKIQKLAKEMQQIKGAPKKEMQQLSDQMQQQQMQQQMQQNSRQMRRGRMQKAQQGQQQMQKRLQQMKKSLMQMKSGMQGRQQRMNISGLRKVLANTLRLSEDQEQLRSDVRGLAPESPTLRTLTRRQSELADGLRTTSDTLQALAGKMPKMTRAVQQETGEALRAMQKATEAMTGRTARQAGGHQKEAMTHLNELALMLSNLLSQAQQSSQGRGSGMSAQQMMKQLKKMGGRQKKLNGQVQQMLNDMQGNRLSQGRGRRLKQLARQQKSIQKQLKKLRRQGAGGKALGDLEKIADQMEKTIQELQGRRLNRKTLKRQQQILTRLLNARKSLQRRGKKNQRRSREATGRDYTRERPADRAPQREAERLRRSLIRALESGYSSDYEELIKRYFERLQKLERFGGSR